MIYGYCPCGAMLLENGCEECEHRTDGRDCLCPYCNPVDCPSCGTKRPYTVEEYRCEGCGGLILTFTYTVKTAPGWVGYL